MIKAIRDDSIISTMGDELGTIFQNLWTQTAVLHHQWQEFQALFGSGTERLQILNRNCASFFSVTQNALWSEILLSLCKLTDPPLSAGKKTLSLSRLPELVKPDLRIQIENLVQKAKDTTSFARDWRNRSLAHSDYELLTNKTAKELATADNTNITAALNAISACLDEVDLTYRSNSTVWKPVMPLNGAENLLRIIRLGNAAKDKEIEAMKSDGFDWNSDAQFMKPLPK